MNEEKAITSETEDFAQSIADSFSSFLLALREIAREGNVGPAISLLLLEISQISLAGARLGAQRDFEPRQEYQPDVGPESDLDDMRLRLAEMLDNLDTYSYVFDPYVPEVVESQLSDDLTSIATDLETGLRHYREGDVAEALWWWQFSYVSSWGNLAGSPRSTRCSRWSPTTGSTPSSPARSEDVAAANEMLRRGSAAADPLST